MYREKLIFRSPSSAAINCQRSESASKFENCLAAARVDIAGGLAVNAIDSF